MNKLLTGLFVPLIFALASIGFAAEPGVTERVITLASPTLEVTLDPAHPTIISYRSPGKPSDDSCLWGAINRMEPEVVFYDGKDKCYKSASDVDARLESSVKSGPSSAIYDCRLMLKDKPVVEFQLIFSVAWNRLSITSRLMKEFGDFRISSVKLPLASARASQPGAKLAMPYSSGRLVDLTKADSVQIAHKLDAENIASIGMVYHDKILGLVSVNSPDDQIVSKIDGNPKAGGLFFEFVRRPEVEKPSLMFLSQSDSSCTVTVIEQTGEKPVDWTAGAALVRDSTPRNINPLYSGSFVYSIVLDRMNGSVWTSFNEALELIKRVNRLTGGVKQIVYLSGWKTENITDVSGINKRLGTFDQLQNLIREAGQENAVVSIVDNYCSIAKENPDWDEAFIAKGPDGEPAADISGYVINPVKYMKKVRERAARTIDLLDIEKTILLERFSDSPDTIDFDPELPANRQKCIGGKLAIISQFNKLGIDTASDTFTSPFAARIGYFRHIARNLPPKWSDEEKIPLIPMIYHGKAAIGDNPSTDTDILGLILDGWTAAAEFDKTTSDDRITELYYLVTLPMSSFSNSEISAYRKDGNVERVSYNSNSYVEADRKKSTYTIVKNGITIARNFATMAPAPDGKIAVYSRDAVKIVVDLPESWKDAEKVKVTGPSEKEKPPVKIKGRKLTIDASPRTVYRISYLER